MPFSESLAGKSLGDYEIRRELGRGGMGVVYQALDRSLDRTVALKVLAPQAMDAEESIGRFLIEARAAAKLNHPNIVTIHAVGEQDGRHYIAMEFVRVSCADRSRSCVRRSPLSQHQQGSFSVATPVTGDGPPVWAANPRNSGGITR